MAMAPMRRGVFTAATAAKAAALARRQLSSSASSSPALLGRAGCWRVIGCSDHRRFASSSSSSSSSSSASSSSSTNSFPPPRKVAVLGGGLTGLATAHYLAMLLPSTSRITVFEGSGRTGGWIDSSSTASPGKSPEKGSKTGSSPSPPEILEAGARMVAPQRNAARYDDLLLLELIDELGLVDELRVSTTKAANYIYYPDHLVNVNFMSEKPVRYRPLPAAMLPEVESAQGGNNDMTMRAATWEDSLSYWRSMFQWVTTCLGRVLREPVFTGFLPAVWNYLVPSQANLKASNKRMDAAGLATAMGHVPPHSSDESVGDFMAAQLGGRREPVDNILSALMHGIYGGDVWRLSVASSVFRGHWLKATIEPMVKRFKRQARIDELRQHQRQSTGAGGLSESEKAALPKGGAIGNLPPLTAAARDLARKYDDSVPTVLAMESDLGLLYDIRARMWERNRRWQQNPHKERRQQQKQQQRSFSRVEGAEEEEGGGDEAKSPCDTFGSMAQASTQWTQFGFADGFGTLTDALTRSLRRRPNVQIRTNEPVTALRYDKQRQQVQITTANTPPAVGGDTFDRVISTLASPTLFRLTGGLLPSLRNEHAVTIQVVNLYYAEPGLHRPYDGFGYLIPQSVPLEENPEGALGVMFDSDRELGMRRLNMNERATAATTDELRAHTNAALEQAVADAAAKRAAETTKGTKYTVMLGGHYWDSYRYPDDFPAPDEAVRMAEAVLRRHLRDSPGWGAAAADSADQKSESPTPTPVATATKLCRECIPQHYVGHGARMAAADADLRRAFGGGRLVVAGGSFTATGPGVLPSVRSAYDVALRVAGRGYRTANIQDSRNEVPMAHVGDTGLGRFADPATDRVVPLPRRDIVLRFGNVTGYSNGAFTTAETKQEKKNV